MTGLHVRGQSLIGQTTTLYGAHAERDFDPCYRTV